MADEAKIQTKLNGWAALRLEGTRCLLALLPRRALRQN
jgi:hypothetical protein